MDEPEVWRLRDRLDHPWIKDRSREVAANIRRLEETIERAEAEAVPQVRLPSGLRRPQTRLATCRMATCLDVPRITLIFGTRRCHGG